MANVTVPEWVKDAVFYQIFPDRFAKSERVPKPANLEPWGGLPTLRGFKGGDLLGVVEKLDYLQDLGITAIYFNPIFQSTANHRYHTYDYYQVDPILGGNAALRTLLDEAHRRDMRVVLDGVFNHASRGFFQFNHILENGPDSPYVDWFIVHGYPLCAYEEHKKCNYAAWWGNRELPKFNIGYGPVREFLLGVAEHWVKFGIDGWRLDVPEEIDDDAFWQEFRRRVKAANPEAYIVGEIWHEARRWLQGDQFDAVMNYGFNRACLGFFGGPQLNTKVRPGGYHLKSLNARKFAGEIDELLGLYDPEVTQVQLNLLSSHDEPRFLTMAGGDQARLELATLFQMTFPGAPCVYYGDEIGMESDVTMESARYAFPWAEHRWNSRLRDAFKAAIALRKQHPALRRGDYTRLYAKGDSYVFGRRLGDQTLVVAFNAGESPDEIDVPVRDYLADGAQLHDVRSDEVATVTKGKLGLVLDPLSGTVLEVA